MPVLTLHEITKRFGATTALDGVSLEFNPGEVHALIGENGAGKSTLMNVITGAVKPDEGSMALDGRGYRPGSPAEARNHGIVLIHQELSLFPHLSIDENIFMGIEPSKRGLMDFAASRKRAAALLAEFGHPDVQPTARVSRLPIALRQVVEICRAIASSAQFVLMDEPTSSLQGRDVERLFAVIRRLKNDGICVVYISHFLEEVREIGDRYAVLRDGKNVSSGSLADTADSTLIAQMVGRSLDLLFPERKTRPRDDTLLTVSGLTAPPAVKSCEFQLKAGEVLGIAGLMGSGRTEMVRSIYGLQPAASGEMSVNGRTRPIKHSSPAESISDGLGYVSEDRQGEGLAQPLAIADNITMTRLERLSTFGWLSAGRQRQQAQKWAGRMAIKARDLSDRVSSLSGGNQQKVAIARLLNQEVSVLLLDEPTRGIDIGSKAQIYELIAQLADQGKGVLLISSYLPELFGMCDRLAVMCRGQLRAARPISEWTPESVMEAAVGKN